MTHATGQRIGERLRGNQWPLLPWMENEKVIESPANRNLMTQRETNAALKFIAANKNKPFFLYLPTTCPAARASHLPARHFAANPRTARGRCGGGTRLVRRSDFDALKKHNIDERTLVIWTSDNGARAAIRRRAATLHSAAGATPRRRRHARAGHRPLAQLHSRRQRER